MIIGHSIGDARGRIITMDARVCAFLHRPLDQLVGKSYLELTHPDDRLVNATKIASLGGGDDLVQIRKRYLRPDGATPWVDLQVSQLNSGSDAGLMLGTLSLASPPAPIIDPHELWRRAQRQIELVEQRVETLGPNMGNDHAWSILLQIYVAEAEGRAIDLDGIMLTAGFAPRPASPRLTSRWLHVLHEQGLIEYQACDVKAKLQLSTKGIASLEKLLSTAD